MVTTQITGASCRKILQVTKPHPYLPLTEISEGVSCA